MELLLKHFPHSLHSNNLSALWIALCVEKKVILNISLLAFLPVLGQTYLMAKCLVANFTGVRSESIQFKRVALMLKRIELPASIMTPSYMHL